MSYISGHCTHAYAYVSLLARKRTRHPVETLVQTVSCGRASRLDEPLAVAHVVQSKFISHLCSCHCVWQILFVCENKQDGVTHLVFVKHLGQFLASILNAVTIVAVNDEDQTLRVLVVVPPERANFVLTTNIP